MGNPAAWCEKRPWGAVGRTGAWGVIRAGALPAWRAAVAGRRAKARPTGLVVVRGGRGGGPRPALRHPARAQRQMKKQPSIDLSRLTCRVSPSLAMCTVLEKVTEFLTSSIQTDRWSLEPMYRLPA